MEEKRILVTGAAGKTGTSVLRELAERGVIARALVRDQRQAEKASRVGARETIVGDFRDEASLRQALEGVSRIYHICPNFLADEVEIGARMIELSKDAGVEHFVFHSVLHPQIEAMPHHWRKMRVEELLFESGLPFTTVQPSAYLQNLRAFRQAAEVTGEILLPYSVDARLSMVDLRDVGEVVAEILTSERLDHRFATYELCGRSVTHHQVAEAFSQALGRPVRARRISIEQWRDKAEKSGLAEVQIHELAAMFRYYDRYGFVGNPNVLRWILGREPRTLEDYSADDDSALALGPA